MAAIRHGKWSILVIGAIETILFTMFLLTALYLTKQVGTGTGLCKQYHWKGLNPYLPDAFGKSIDGTSNGTFTNWWRSSRPRCVQAMTMMSLSWVVVSIYIFSVGCLGLLFFRTVRRERNGGGKLDYS